MSDVRGVLRAPPDDAWSLHRLEPGPRLAPYAVLHWIVVWDLRGHEPHHLATLPHPATHLVVEEGGARLYGPLRERFERTLQGRGTRSACASGRAACDRCCRRPCRRSATGGCPPTRCPASTRRRSRARSRPRTGSRTRLLEQDRTITRASELADRLALSVRSVQRLFADHVGLGPSWVIRRYGLHEAAARATEGRDVDWARLAVTLGYYDFTATIGTAPARYAAAQDQ